MPHRAGQPEAISKFGGLNASAAVSPDGRKINRFFLRMEILNYIFEI